VQREVGGGFDLGVLATERVIDPHEQARGGLGDIVVVGGVVFLVLTTPVVPARLASGSLRAWNGRAIGLAAIILRFAALGIEMARVVPTTRSELRARNASRGLHGGGEALFVLRGLVSIQHRHPDRRCARWLNPDRIGAGDAFRLAQGEVGAVAIDVTAVGRRFRVVERNGFEGGGGDFGGCRG
jgi:hypothetical protein